MAMIPSPVDVDYEISSTIGEKRFDKTLQVSGMTRLLFPFYRMWFKLSSGVGKRYAYHIGSRK
ncbi:MAG: hypothetical protein V7727_08035 [Sneathiella sp.]